MRSCAVSRQALQSCAILVVPLPSETPGGFCTATWPLGFLYISNRARSQFVSMLKACQCIAGGCVIQHREPPMNFTPSPRARTGSGSILFGCHHTIDAALSWSSEEASLAAPASSFLAGLAASARCIRRAVPEYFRQRTWLLTCTRAPIRVREEEVCSHTAREAEIPSSSPRSVTGGCSTQGNLRPSL